MDNQQCLDTLRAHPTVERISAAMFYWTASRVQCLIAHQLDHALDTEPGMVAIMEAMAEICAAHGYPEGFPEGQESPEFEALRAEWAREHRNIQSRLYLDCGHAELAALIRDNYAEFRRRWLTGADAVTDLVLNTS